MKLIVMARGLGTRMRAAGARGALTADQAAAAQRGDKALMPIDAIGGRVLLDYVLSRAADAGITEVCLVVPPVHDGFLAHYQPSRLSRLRVDVAVQEQPTGTAHAVLAARAWADGHDCVVVNGDNLYPVAALRALVEREGAAIGAFTVGSMVGGPMGLPRERLTGYALVQVDASGGLQVLIEKPDAHTLHEAGDEALVSMNLWRVDTRLFEACATVGVSARGEYELPAAVMLGLARGAHVEVCRVDGPVLDLSRQDDVAVVARALREEQVRL